jgi:hypothetical protein
MLPHRGNMPPRVKKVIDLLLGEGELPFLSKAITAEDEKLFFGTHCVQCLLKNSPHWPKPWGVFTGHQAVVKRSRRVGLSCVRISSYVRLISSNGAPE